MHICQKHERQYVTHCEDCVNERNSAESAGYVLKPCPFCGGKAAIDTQSNYVTIIADHVADCLMDGEDFGRVKPTDRAMDWLIEAWNRRT